MRIVYLQRKNNSSREFDVMGISQTQQELLSIRDEVQFFIAQPDIKDPMMVRANKKAVTWQEVIRTLAQPPQNVDLYILDKPRVIITVTVDWDGMDIDPTASAASFFALKSLHQQFRKVPLTHFITPVYFTRSTAIANSWKTEITKYIRNIDEVGLHIHCWRTLLQKAGIQSATNWPQFEINTIDANYNYNPRTKKDEELLSFTGDQSTQENDSGHGIALGALDLADIRQLIRESKNILSQHTGINNIRSFRCGAWLASGRVFEAVSAEGFDFEASAVNPDYWQRVFNPSGSTAGRNLKSWLNILWSNRPAIAPHLQGAPVIDWKEWNTLQDIQASRPFETHNLVELPDTCILADYVSEVQMSSHINLAKQLAEQSGKDVFTSLGFHFDSICYKPYYDRIEKTLSAMSTDNALAWMTIADAGDYFKSI